MVSYILIVLAAYLLGSIPTGYLVGKARGVDIRKVGSGNMGATNVFRVLGKGAGIVVLVVDGLKGYAACTWLFDIFIHFNWINVPAEQLENLRIVAGISAVLGHNYTCWLGFKGGKGVATSTGVYFALAPLAAGVALGTWILVFAVTRYVSLASIAGALILPIVVWIMHNNLLLELVTTALGLMVVVKHKGNIQRLINGTENRFGGKPAAQEAAK